MKLSSEFVSARIRCLKMLDEWPSRPFPNYTKAKEEASLVYSYMVADYPVFDENTDIPEQLERRIPPPYSKQEWEQARNMKIDGVKNEYPGNLNAINYYDH